MGIGQAVGGSMQGAIGVAQRTDVPTTPMHAHGQHLHELAMRLSNANDSLSRLLARLRGPVPEPGGGKEAGNMVQADPSGLIYVAKFQAEHIERESARLDVLIRELEQII